MVKVVNAFASIFWFYEQLESIGQTGQALERLHPFTALTATEKRSELILAQRTKGVTVVDSTRSTSRRTVALAVVLGATVAVVAALLHKKND